MSTKFQFGQTIRLKGLNNAIHNGKVACVENFPTHELCSNGRYRVKLIDVMKTVDVKTENMELACIRCHKGGENLMYCGKCRHARYCDRECQRIDWERHKRECAKCSLDRDLSKNPLLLAAGVGDLGRIRKLVQDGIDVNMSSHTTNVFALHVAATNGHVPIVQYLLQQGADKDKADNNGLTAIYYAAAQGHLAVVQYLAQQGADKDKTNNKGISPLQAAAVKGHLAIVQYLRRTQN